MHAENVPAIIVISKSTHQQETRDISSLRQQDGKQANQLAGHSGSSKQSSLVRSKYELDQIENANKLLLTTPSRSTLSLKHD